MPLSPEIIPADTNRGEKTFFSCAKGSGLFENESTFLFHSLIIARPGFSKLVGEADFIYLDSKYLIVFEVKGGAVNYSESLNKWYVLDGQTEKDPFRQAYTNMFAIRENLSEKLLLNFKNGEKLIFGYCVVITEREKPQQITKRNGTIEYDTDLIADYHDVADGNSFRNLIVRLKNYWSNHQKYLTATENNRIGLTQQELQRIKYFFRSEIDFRIPHQEIIRKTDAQISEFTEQQKAVLISLNFNPGKGGIVLGGPGTGKTILATELAINKAQAGKVLFICFNNNLADFLTVQMSSNSNIDVWAIQKLYTHMLSRFQIKLDKDRITSSEEFYDEVRPITFYDTVETFDSQISKYDYLIIDEGQDIFCEYHILALSSVLKGGMESGNWTFFMDYDYQKLYNTFDELFLASFQRLYPSIVLALTVNCRNHKIITSKASYCTGLPEQACLRTEGHQTLLKYFEDEDERTKKVNNKIKELKRSGVPANSIAVLCWNTETVKHLLERSGQSTFKEFSVSEAAVSDDKVVVSTVHGFKGLEAHYVILADLKEGVFRPEIKWQAYLLYLAFTRAKTQFILFAHSSYEDVFIDLQTSVNRQNI